MKRAFLAGGAGFIGSHLSDICLREGIRVRVYDNFSTGKREFFNGDECLDLVEGDILDPERLSLALREFHPDVLYHLAAIHHIPTCEKTPEKAFRTNVEGLQSVLSACAFSRVPRIVFASTGAVYGESDGPLAENSRVAPKGIYALSKFFGERLLESYVSRTDLQAVAARLFNNVGPHETNDHLIPDILSQILSGGRTLLLGNLLPRRDYVHVRDCAAALLALGRLEAEKEALRCFQRGLRQGILGPGAGRPAVRGDRGTHPGAFQSGPPQERGPLEPAGRHFQDPQSGRVASGQDPGRRPARGLGGVPGKKKF